MEVGSLSVSLSATRMRAPIFVDKDEDRTTVAGEERRGGEGREGVEVGEGE